MHRKHWKRAIAATLTSLATAALGTPTLLGQTADTALSIPAGLQNLSSSDAGPMQHLRFAHFNIPFEVDPSGPLPREVHLWVSPDQGRSWLKYASTTPDKRSFEFHAAAEGEYLFAVQTRDGQGASALAASPPMRIMIDTTQPELQLSVDVSPAGRLVIDYQLSDPYLVEDSVRLAYSADGRAQWEDVRIGSLGKTGTNWSGRCEIDMPHCRELDVRITANDSAQNKAEKVFHFSAPRTAAAGSGMQLASQRGDYRTYDPNAWVAAAPPKPVHSAQNFPQAGAANLQARMLNGAGSAPMRPQSGLITSGTPLAGPLGPAQPGVAQRSPAQPGSAQPGSAQPGSAQPGSAQPGSAQPGPGLLASQGGVAWNPNDAAGQRSMLGRTTGPAPATARTVAVQPGMNQPTGADTGTRLATAPTMGYEELPPPAAVDDSSSEATLGGELELSNSVPAATSSSASPADRQLPVVRRELSNIDLGSPAPAPREVPSSNAAPSLNIERPFDASTGGASSADSPAGKAPLATPSPANGLSDAVGITSSSPASIEDAYHSRSRTFSLDYAVDSLRGAAVSDIELWGTEDRGGTWQKWGSDPDRQSPFDVQVGNDGLFGFRMVVIGANGLISNRPESGDPADMWINVDTEMPAVNITRALYGEGNQAGMLVIEFTGSDDNMHERPISLSYSESPTGPWATLASGLPSSGQYVWKPDSSLPRQVFLRAQAVDRAGNTHEHRLELPVSLRGLAPQGRIQGFRPIDPKS